MGARKGPLRRGPEPSPRKLAAHGDAAETPRREAGLERILALQGLEHAVALKIADAESVSAAMTAAIRAICEAEGWECGRYFRLDNEAGVLRFAESWGVNEPAIQEFIERSRGIVYKPGAGLMGRVWQSGQPLWVADVTKDSRAQRAAFTVDLGIHGGFVFPVKSEGKTIGVLAFNTREIREADERLLKAILVIGSQMGQFLERKRAEEEQRRFRAAMDASADLMLLVDPVSLRYIDVNDAACRALGYSREELLKMGPADIFSTSRDDLTRVYARMIAGELTAPSVKGRYRRKDGSLLDVEAYPRAVKTGDGYVIVSVARDITERLATEEMLRRFRVAMDNSADMIVLIDRATMRFIDMNNTACRLLGYTREELLQMGPQDVLPTGRADLERIYDEFIANPTHTHGMQSYYRRKDGTAFAFESTRHVLRTGDSYIIAAISRDITPRIEAEEALRSSEERFRSLTSLSSDLYWEQDEQFRFTTMTGTGSQRVNVRTFPAIGKKRWEQNYINMTADQWADHIALLEAHKQFRDMELCRLDEAGNKIWISISGEPVFDSSGAFRGYRGVGKDITERKLDEERIQFLANHDALTSLPNRTMFNEVLTIAIQNARRYKRNFAVLFIDLDRFKNINDTLGHDAGDKLLQQMGKRLLDTMRTSDIVARLGGDEFVVLVQEISEAKQVASVARKVLSALVQPMTIQGQECRVTASIGICMYPAEAQDELALMKNADIAMYRAKEDGKNNYKFYTEEMNVHSFERLALETSLRRGLERSEFLLHYQAKVDLQSGSITGVEALIRWQHPDLGLVPPAQFIPLAEETGLIVPIGRWVLHTACAQNVAWQRQGLPPVHIAVNLSARQFADDDLVQDVADALRSTGLRPELLELELTESVVIQNTERAGGIVSEIKKMGVRLAIDDFGVGYSSLTHLKRFPIDTLKVDRSFIRDLPADPEDKAITEAIIAMGKSLNLTVVAEGVETQEQQSFLQELDCDEMQGYYFSKPIPGDAFAELLRRRGVEPKH
ncbi:MAG TPA: EAL domain-containing protein [Burkholderiales bacterium]|nr:EAL domain-containing protein [Burkholderiales bacterium]